MSLADVAEHPKAREGLLSCALRALLFANDQYHAPGLTDRERALRLLRLTEKQEAARLLLRETL